MDLPEHSTTVSVSVSVLAKHGTIAFFGGLAHAINKHRTGESKGWLDLLALTAMSSFFGLLFGFIALYLFKNNEYITLAMAGTGGWLGIEGVGMLLALIKKLLP